MIFRVILVLSILLNLSGVPRASAVPPYSGGLVSDIEKPYGCGGRVIENDIHGDPLPVNAIARFGTIRLRNDRRTVSVAYCPDGRLIASADEWGAVSVWNARTGENIAQIYNPIYSKMVLNQRVTFSPDGRCLIYLTRDKGSQAWDVVTKRSFSLPIILHPIAFSPNGELAAGESNSSFVIYDLRKHVVRFERQGGTILHPLYMVTFSSDGKFIATAERTRDRGEFPSTIRLWDTNSGKQVDTWGSHCHSINSLSFSSDGKFLATGGAGGVYLWDVVNHRRLIKLEEEGGTAVFSPGGKKLASVGFSSTVHLWDPANREKVLSIPTGNGWVTALAFSPDGKKLLTGGWHHALFLWDVTTGKEILPKEGHRFDIHSVQFAPDGKTLASRSGDQSVLLWDIASGKLRQRFPLADDDRLQGRSYIWSPTPSSTLAYSPDGKTLAAVAGGYNNRAFIWDTMSFRKKLTINTAKRPPTSIAFSQAGDVLAVIDDRVRLWSTSSGFELPLSPIAGSGPIAFSPNGCILATNGLALRSSPASSSLLCLWDWRGNRLLRKFNTQKDGPRCLSFSFDGQLLATCGGSHQQKNSLIHLWETATGNIVHSLDHSEDVLCIALSPNGRLLAFGGEGDRTVHIWDIVTRKELAQLKGHLGNIYCFAFSPDGKTLASGSADTTILLWDVSKLQPDPPPSIAQNELANELPRLWKKIQTREGAEAYQAIWRLIGAGDDAVAFLGRKLDSVPAPDAKHIQQWIADLDSDNFDKRQSATAQLTKLRDLAEPALKKALQGKPSLEARKRLESLLVDIVEQTVSDSELRQIRALHALELIGSPAARAVLKKLAEGAPGARMTRDAKLALQRLERRTAKP